MLRPVVRYWTLPQADQALAEVRRLLAEARDVTHRLRTAHDQLEDLRILYGPELERQGRPERAEAAAWQEKHVQAREDLEAVLLKFDAMGVEVKDLDAGLVDFRSRFGDHDVYLCWKEGEPEVGWWHPLHGGYAARRRVPDFTPVG